MEKKGLDRAIAVACAAFVMLAILFLGLLALVIIGRPEKQPSVPTPTEQPEQALTMAQDVLPDRSKLYYIYEGNLQSPQGGSLALSSLRGKPFALLFWSSWCQDCKAFFNDGFETALREAKEADAQLLLVCRGGVRGETMESMKEGLVENGIQETSYLDENAELYTALGLHAVPSIAVFSADGLLVHTSQTMPAAGEMTQWFELAASRAAQTESFIRKKLLQPDGGLPSDYRVTAMGEAVPGKTYLSETQGLMMLYAVRKGDKALFDSALSFANQALYRGGLYAWRMENGEKSGANALLDDLRILGALLDAQQRWSGYDRAISEREEALRMFMIKDGGLRSFVDMNENVIASDIALSYLDVALFRRLTKYNAAWEEIAGWAENILKICVISEGFPLYASSWSFETKNPSLNNLHMAEALLTVLHAQQAGIERAGTIDLLENMLASGSVYAYYDMKGEPVEGYRYESTAVYALLADIAQLSGRADMARMALEHVERMRCGGELLGSFGQNTAQQRYTYDELQAMLAWQMLEESGLQLWKGET